MPVNHQDREKAGEEDNDSRDLSLSMKLMIRLLPILLPSVPVGGKARFNSNPLARLFSPQALARKKRTGVRVKKG